MNAESAALSRFLSFSEASVSWGGYAVYPQCEFSDLSVAEPDAAYEARGGAVGGGGEAGGGLAVGASAEVAAAASAAAASVPAEGDSLSKIAGEVRACTSCPLCKTRKNAVPGEGVEAPLVLVVGEGPGGDEDASGRPFVGRAGQLLDKMLSSIDLSREKNCFIANIVKCRPPGNRDPAPEESAACVPFLRRQISLLSPLLILSAGRISSSLLLQTNRGITSLRGIWGVYEGIPVLPTFHPSYLLRDESQKAPAWEDMKSLCRRLCSLDAAYEEATRDLRLRRKI